MNTALTGALAAIADSTSTRTATVWTGTAKGEGHRTQLSLVGAERLAEHGLGAGVQDVVNVDHGLRLVAAAETEAPLTSPPTDSSQRDEVGRTMPPITAGRLPIFP